MYIIIAIIVSIICIIDYLQMLHFYQLESYNLHCGIKTYYIKYYETVCVFTGLALLGFLQNLLFRNKTSDCILLSILFAIFAIKTILFCINYAKNKMKLKYTKRVIRHMFLYINILLLTITCILLTKTYILPIVIVVNLLIFIFVTFIIIPLEKIIYCHYINKAKKILTSNKNLKVIAVTGSYGKTSVKNILYELLSQKYNVCVSPASYNTPMGISKTIIENLKPYHNVLILEFGAKKIGEIEYLCKCFPVQYGIITSVGPQHLQTFGSIENITKTKMELYEYIKLKHNIVCNLSNEYIHDYLKNEHSRVCGVMGEDVSLNECESCSRLFCVSNIRADEERSTFTLSKLDNNFSIVEEEVFETKLLGVHNVINVVLSIAMSKNFGLTYGQIKAGLSNVVATDHRLQLKKVADYLVIDNAYNSNPVSFRCAVDALCLFENVRKIVITPGVVEQGENSYKENYRLGQYMASRVDCVYVVNKVNRKALCDGIMSIDNCNVDVRVFDKFGDIDWMDFSKDDVILIENDLPDNYN